MKKVIELIGYAAQTDFSVIIQGETGTGKTFVAEALHNLSKRNNKPFVRVDIGLIPDSLIESELFGYRKGAFTNASGSKIGFFEAANSGTIFIDEIENMSHATQSKLLNVIERKEVYPIGSTSPTSYRYPDYCCHQQGYQTKHNRKRVQGRPVLPSRRIHHHHSAPQGKE